MSLVFMDQATLKFQVDVSLATWALQRNPVPGVLDTRIGVGELVTPARVLSAVKTMSSVALRSGHATSTLATPLTCTVMNLLS